MTHIGDAHDEFAASVQRTGFLSFRCTEQVDLTVVTTCCYELERERKKKKHALYYVLLYKKSSRLKIEVCVK